MFLSRALFASSLALLGAAIPAWSLTSPASAAPSHWHPVDETVSDVFEVCPGVNVLWELTTTGKQRYTTRASSEIPLYEEHVTDVEIYTNLANNQWVRVVSTRVEHPLSVTDNGDGTVTYLYNHTGRGSMYAEDGSLVARLYTGGLRIEKVWDLSGTPSDPSDDEFVRGSVPNGFDSTGRHDADSCTALVGAIG